MPDSLVDTEEEFVHYFGLGDAVDADEVVVAPMVVVDEVVVSEDLLELKMSKILKTLLELKTTNMTKTLLVLNYMTMRFVFV